MNLRLFLADLIRRRREMVLLGAILLVAVFFRFWQLHHLPPGLHPDEAANGLDIFRIFGGDIRPLYNTNGPREALFFYLQAIFVALFGNSILALRIAPAIAGTLAVWTTYLLTKAWFGRRRAMVAAFLMAVTPWAVIMSRLGYRASLVPLFVTLTLWLFTRGFQTARRKWFIWAGISLGAGMYTYISFRVLILALGLVGLVAIFKNPGFLKRWGRLLAISVVAFAITLTPMALFGLKYPGDVLGTRASTSFLNPELNQGQPLAKLLDTAVKTALMFNIYGDENYRHNLGGQPMLNVFVGIMFILGILLSLVNITRLRYLALLTVFLVMLLPEVLTAEGIPHALRAVGALPAALMLAALGVIYMLERWYTTFPVNSAARSLGSAAIALLLLLSAYHGYNQYFVAWAGDPNTYEAFSEDAVAMSKFMNQNPHDGLRYALIGGYTNITVAYLTHGRSGYTRLEPGHVDGLVLSEQPKQFIISKDFKDEALSKLRLKFPDGNLSPRYSPVNGQELYFIYEVQPDVKPN